MKTAKRSALALVPKQPFLDWVNGLETGAPALTLKELQRESAMYLIPEFSVAYLEENFDVFFRLQLAEWWTDESYWPAKRSFRMFEKWFTHRVYAKVIDAARR